MKIASLLETIYVITLTGVRSDRRRRGIPGNAMINRMAVAETYPNTVGLLRQISPGIER